MPPTTPYLEARLLRRYKRFLADVELLDGTRTTVHCPNTGAMLGCAEPGSRVWLSVSTNKTRKYPLGLEVVETRSGALVGVNPLKANHLFRDAFTSGRIAGLEPYDTLRAEVAAADGRSRLDFVLTNERTGKDCMVEVKSVTARDDQGLAFFPDAVSIRAIRHLESLASQSAGGSRSVLFFCIQRNDVMAVRPAAEIHREYAEALASAQSAGVEILAYRCTVSPDRIVIESEVDVVVDVV